MRDRAGQFHRQIHAAAGPLLDLGHRIIVAWVDCMGRAQFQRMLSFVFGKVYGNDRSGPGRHGPQRPRKADTAKPDDGASLPHFQIARVQHRANAGQYGTAQQGCRSRGMLLSMRMQEFTDITA